jgi:hypothetical protein
MACSVSTYLLQAVEQLLLDRVFKLSSHKSLLFALDLTTLDLFVDGDQFGSVAHDSQHNTSAMQRERAEIKCITNDTYRVLR